MSELKIDFEWIDPLAAKGAELRATWARFCLVVDGRLVTRAYDERSHTMREAIYLPLYPLAEWLAEQWWPLWCESAPSGVARPDHEQRHSLVHAREGYALPPLRIEPAGASVHLSWSPEQLASHRVEFTGGGEAWLDTVVVKREFSSLLDAVVGRLEAEGITGTRFQQDWQSVRTADNEEREFCECAGALGLDPYSLEEDRQHEIEEAGRILPGEILEEFFQAARVPLADFRKDVQEVTTAARRIGENHADLTSFRELREALAGRASLAPPWEQGYALAREVRSHLRLDGRALKSIDCIGKIVGVTSQELASAVTLFSSREVPFVALVGTNHEDSPAFAVRPGRPVSSTFHFCRALSEYLCSSTRSAMLVTDANTARQKRNRAFAAEFLAPTAELRARIQSPLVTSEQADEIADEFGVSAWVIAHQLVNHDIARVGDAP